MGIPYEPGTNLGFWKNHPHPVSFFVYHSDLDFLGGYDHGKRAGVVHVADRDTVPGQEVLDLGQRARRPRCGTRSSPTRTARTSS